MASARKPFDERSATRRLSDLINDLHIDEVRILARLLNDWQKRNQRRHKLCGIMCFKICGLIRDKRIGR